MSRNDARKVPPQTPLQKAAAEGNLELLRLLLGRGANLEQRNCHGETALGYAASWGQLAAVRLLVESGAQINAIEVDPDTGYRATAFDSCEYRHPTVAEYFRSMGGKPLRDLEAETITSG